MDIVPDAPELSAEPAQTIEGDTGDDQAEHGQAGECSRKPPAIERHRQRVHLFVETQADLWLPTYIRRRG